MKIRNIGAIAFLAALSTSTNAQSDAVVGKMGNVEIRTSEVRRFIDAQPPEVRKQIAGAIPELDRLVRSELVRLTLLAEAKSKGVDKKAEVQLMMERARELALLSEYMNEVTRPPASYPSEEDVKQAYEANRGQLATPAQYQLAQIFIAAPENADKQLATTAAKKAADLAAKAQAKGADFAKIARESSEHKDTAPKGGDLGWLPETQILPEIRAAIGKMEKAEVSGAIRSANGWHVVKLLDRRPAGTRPLAEVRDTIVAQLRARRAQEIQRNYVDSLMSRTPPTVNQIELPKLQAK